MENRKGNSQDNLLEKQIKDSALAIQMNLEGRDRFLAGLTSCYSCIKLTEIKRSNSGSELDLACKSTISTSTAPVNSLRLLTLFGQLRHKHPSMLVALGESNLYPNLLQMS
jgi:hypothetical protein